MSSKFNNKGDYFNGSNNKPLTEFIYCKNKEIRNKVNYNISNELERTFTNWRDTRRKIDIIIPGSMVIIWIIYLCIAK